MTVLIVATLLVALLAAAALPLFVLWDRSEGREGDARPRRPLFDVGFPRRGGLLRIFQIGASRPLLLTYRRESRGRFRKVA